jgi:phosphoglucosamine mutase
MVSASHNHAPDNGIKFFSYGGTKLPDEVEERIEAAFGTQPLAPTGAGVGRVSRFADAEDRYALHLLTTIETPLAGLHVVLDCAHGAAAGVSPRVFRDAGAEVTVVGAEPDGLNINQGCGSTHLNLLRETVVALGADVGIAHDGDADRALAVDHTGGVIDGDQIMAILALSMKQRGLLDGNGVVATVMSNLGFHRLMAQHGISVEQTKVGDRYVLEGLAQTGFGLGGEQSGHIILPRHQTTGDGLLTGLMIAQEVARTRTPLKDLAAQMTVFPQVLVNVSGVDKSRTDDHAVAQAIAEAESELGGNGRVLLRPSGTEPLIRIMVEADTKDHANDIAARLATVVKAQLSL